MNLTNDEYVILMQNTNCNEHQYIFEKLLVLRNDALGSDQTWSQHLTSQLPNWRPDTRNPLNRTILIQDSPAIYNLQIWNNLACCTTLTGAGSIEHMDTLVRYLRHTVTANVEPRLAQETGYKLFVYTPREVTLPQEFKNNGSQELTILGDRAPPGTSEWRYCFSFGHTSNGGIWSQALPTQSSIFGQHFGQQTGSKPFGSYKSSTSNQPSGQQASNQPFGQQPGNQPFGQQPGNQQTNNQLIGQQLGIQPFSQQTSNQPFGSYRQPSAQTKGCVFNK